MPRAYWVELARTVRRSLGRFVAIAVICAVGCGFFAGLRMTGVGMRRSADAYFDREHLYDIELVSTMGFAEGAADELASVEGVGAVAPGRSVDVMASMADSSRACRVSSLPAQGSLNGLELEEGRWPESDGECVLVAKQSEPGVVGSSLEVLYGAQDLDPVLSQRSFTVVGTVSSPAYACEAAFATTMLGSGTVGEVAYVRDGAFAPDAPVTELYLSVAGGADELWGTDAYQARVDEVAAKVESKEEALAGARLGEVKAEAQAKVDDGRAEYEDAEREAVEGLEKGEASLADARNQVEDGQRALDEAEATLEQKRGELAAGKARLEGSVSEYEEGKDALDDGSAKLASAQAELEKRAQAIGEARAGLESRRGAVEAARAQVDAFDKGRASLLEAARGAGLPASTVEEARDAAAARLSRLEAAGQEAPAEAVDGLRALVAEADRLASSQGAVDGARDAVKGFDDAEAEVAAGERSLEQARESLKAEQSRLEAAAARLAEGAAAIEQGASELEEGDARMAAGEDELARSSSEVEEGRRRVEEGEAELAEQRQGAESSLAEAKEKLEDAQAEVDAIEAPKVFVLDRGSNYGAHSFLSDSERMDAIASVFPFFFFVVAALVTLTTMTRMVDDDRGLIGTYKALGISNGAVCLKYVAYGALASALGATVGIVAMSQLVPWVIFKAYGIIYAVPARPMPLPMEPGPAAVAAALGVGVTLAATLAACLSTLRESAASLMQPKAPKAGKRILLESIGPLWRRLSFSWKVTCRNIFRYKRRLAMTVVGVAGCTGLLLCGFGVRDAVNDIIDKQYGELTFYNAVVGMKEGSGEAELDAVASRLAEGDDAPVALVMRENLVARDAEGADKAVTLMVPDDPIAFADTTVLRERVGGRPLDLAGGAVVCEKTASQLGVGPGDTVTLYRQDEAGNPTGDPVEVEVAGVCEAYLGSYLYLSPEAYRDAFGGDADADTVLGSVPEGEAGTEEADGLMAMDGVSTVQLSAETVKTYRTMLSSVDLVMVVLIAAAAVLAFVVMYNLANINIAERVREVASLKVLGFLPSEVDAYIFREIVIIAVLGAVAGLFLGTVFEAYVVVTAEVDAAMFGREVHPVSYLYAFGLTLAFCALVLLAMRPKIASIDMVESLKSVE